MKPVLSTMNIAWKVLLVLSLVLSTSTASLSSALSGAVLGSRLIVKYRDQAKLYTLEPEQTDADRASAMEYLSHAASAGLGRDVTLSFIRAMSGGAFVIGLPEALLEDQLQAVVDRLQALPELEYAEPDRLRTVAFTPNDTQYSKQWDLFSPASGSYGINAPAAWDITRGARNIIVGVIDTGITSHFDLLGRTLPGYDFISDAWMANDGDGRDGDPTDPGDWVNTDECGVGSSLQYSTWHGTHVAGTIGATLNNAAGVAGINGNSLILPVRVLGRCGGYVSDILDGMRWAAGLAVPGVPINPNPAKVLNLSLSGLGVCSQTEVDAISAITAAGSSVVVAAGNENSNADSYSPANCPGVITVAATNRNGSRAYYSNYGMSVELSAPGGDLVTSGTTGGILSTLKTGPQDAVADTYAYYQGTSMAAPHVAGVASLLYSLIPSLSPAQVLQVMQNTSTAFPVGSTCTTQTCGSGIVNAGAAVGFLSHLTSLSPNQANIGSTLTLTVNGTNFNNSFKIYWNGVMHTTSYVSSTQLTTQLTASDTASSGFYTVTVSGIHPLYGTLTTSSLLFMVGIKQNYLPLDFNSLVYPVPVSTGVIENGNFESEATGWIAYSKSGFGIIRNNFNPPVAPLSGSYAAWLGGDDSEVGYLQQTVIVDPASPNLTFYHWIISDDICGYDYASVQIDGFMVTYFDLCQPTNTSGWVKQTLNLSAYADKAVFLRIGIVTDKTGISSYFLDDISLSP